MEGVWQIPSSGINGPGKNHPPHTYFNVKRIIIEGVRGRGILCFHLVVLSIEPSVLVNQKKYTYALCVYTVLVIFSSSKIAWDYLFIVIKICYSLIINNVIFINIVRLMWLIVLVIAELQWVPPSCGSQAPSWGPPVQRLSSSLCQKIIIIPLHRKTSSFKIQVKLFFCYIMVLVVSNRISVCVL